jgi:hypothetical protein
LVFVGLKMLAEYFAHRLHWVEEDHHLVHPLASLGLVTSLLGISILASIISSRREQRRLASPGAIPATQDAEAGPLDAQNGVPALSNQPTPAVADESNTAN